MCIKQLLVVVVSLIHSSDTGRIPEVTKVTFRHKSIKQIFANTHRAWLQILTVDLQCLIALWYAMID